MSRHRATPPPVVNPRVEDPPPRLPHSPACRPDYRDLYRVTCVVCTPALYARRHARHRADRFPGGDAARWTPPAK